jgi:hypothetical protein
VQPGKSGVDRALRCERGDARESRVAKRRGHEDGFRVAGGVKAMDSEQWKVNCQW